MTNEHTLTCKECGRQIWLCDDPTDMFWDSRIGPWCDDAEDLRHEPVLEDIG